MEKLNDNLTIAQLDKAIKSLEGQKEGVSEKTANTLDSLVAKYKRRKTLILSLYLKNVKKNINLKGIDKSMLSLTLLARYGVRQNGVQKAADATLNALSSKGVRIGIGITAGVLTSTRILAQTVGWQALGNAFSKYILPAAGKVLGFGTGVPGVGILSGVALAGGLAIAVGSLAKKIQKNKELKYEAEYKAEQAMNSGVKSLRGDSFYAGKFEGNLNAITNEIVNDPSIRQHLQEMLSNGMDPSITPVMKANIRQALFKANEIEQKAKKANALAEINGLVYDTPQDKLNAYIENKIKADKLKEIVDENQGPAQPVGELNISSIPANEKANAVNYYSICQAKVRADIDAYVATHPNASLNDIGISCPPTQRKFGLGSNADAFKDSIKSSISAYAEAYLKYKKESASKSNEIDKKLAAYNDEFGLTGTAHEVTRSNLNSEYANTNAETDRSAREIYNSDYRYAAAAADDGLMSPDEIVEAIKNGALKQMVDERKAQAPHMGA